MKITKTQLNEIIKEELEAVISEACCAHRAMHDHGPFVDRNVKVYELLAYMGLTPQQIEQVKDVLELNKAEAEVEDSFGIKLEEELDEKIKKVDGGYYVTSKSGKHLSKKPHKTRKAALAQLGAVEASKAGRTK